MASGGVYEFVANNDPQKKYAVKIFTEKRDQLSKVVNEIKILQHLDRYVKSDNLIAYHGFAY
jgi:hypothetical protein